MSSVVQLLQVMARTPAGSWQACPAFGLRDLFEDNRLRADVVRIAMQRINQSLVDLGLGEFHIVDIVRELSAQRDTDTYALTIGRHDGYETTTAVISTEQ